jgi:hypothetical protein
MSFAEQIIGELKINIQEVSNLQKERRNVMRVYVDS